jgi:hypothetical protein
MTNMRVLNTKELTIVAGGAPSPVPVANPNACNSAITGATGVGALIASGAAAVVTRNPIVVGVAGTLGGLAAGSYTSSNNPACAPATPAAPASDPAQAPQSTTNPNVPVHITDAGSPEGPSIAGGPMDDAGGGGGMREPQPSEVGDIC